jgi:hypothetical protein
MKLLLRFFRKLSVGRGASAAARLDDPRGAGLEGDPHRRQAGGRAGPQSAADSRGKALGVPGRRSTSTGGVRLHTGPKTRRACELLEKLGPGCAPVSAGRRLPPASPSRRQPPCRSRPCPRVCLPGRLRFNRRHIGYTGLQTVSQLPAAGFRHLARPWAGAAVAKEKGPADRRALCWCWWQVTGLRA